jgi:SNF2 family DNA or RNA helicase
MTPYAFKADAPPPMEHQRRALRFVIDHGGVAGLVMDPGTGKTRVCVDYLAMRALKRGHVNVLVTAPLSALDTWPDQFRQWCPDGVRVEVIEPSGSVVEKAERIVMLARAPRGGARPPTIRLVLLNHDTFASRALVKGTKTVLASDRIVNALNRWSPNVLVVDEMHRFKGHTSNRTRTLRKVARHIPHRLGLTGTVAPHSPLDIFGQWLLLNPDTFGPDWETFRYTYAKWGGFENRKAVKWINQDMLRRAIAQDAIVVRKCDALDLPALTDVVLPIRMRPREEKAYRQMEEEACAQILGEEAEAVAPSALVQMLRLRQITGGYVGYDDLGVRKTEEFGRTKAKVCADKVYDLAEAGRKVVVFAHFRHDLKVISEEVSRLKVKNLLICYVDGDTPPADRMHQRFAFRDHEGPAVFVAQIRTMSLAVNELVVASEAIFYSLSERRDDYEQARDRLNRIGQKNPMTMYHLVVPDSIDGVMLRAHRERLDLEETILEYAKRKVQTWK